MDHKFFREKGVNDVSGITETTTEFLSHSCKNSTILIFSELITANN
ncbi:hypothetical protein HMPREF1033_02939 [Tannerella sp. 6_1_58FAA_CT1]|jgi:hypothetical protein|nr:hypothetical protein HMPREF1033_02939 [Tannerella sp. 6_1_58FAA_CT1]